MYNGSMYNEKGAKTLSTIAARPTASGGGMSGTAAIMKPATIAGMTARRGALTDADPLVASTVEDPTAKDAAGTPGRSKRARSAIRTVWATARTTGGQR